ncbi:MAG: sensor histidine kinase, partial [Algicola sp.]|nr:sensor histidine kinase [Algicola sp.]
MNIIIEDDFKGEFIKEFRPLEITTIVDNLISNSEKANATTIKLNFSKKKSSLLISFEDNGKGIPKKHIDNIYDL